MASFVVSAPLVIAKTAEGGDVHVYQDAPVPAGQTAEWIERHLKSGMISETDQPEPEPGSEPGSEPEPELSSGEAPAGNASRDEWHAYALSQGYATDELDGLSRDDIRKLLE